MAIHMKVDGSVWTVRPEQGDAFSLEELQALVGGDIEMVPASQPGLVLVVNESGLLNGLPWNGLASALLRSDVVGGQIVGDAVLCTRAEAGFDE